jgi:hypothetical protein
LRNSNKNLYCSDGRRRPIPVDVEEVSGRVPNLDWNRVADWSTRIAAGDLGAIAAVFRANGAYPPEANLSPTTEQIGQDPLRFLLDHWLKLAGDAPMPHVRQIDALELGPALGYIMLLDVVEGGRDFRYRLFGSKIARLSNFDMTGRLLSQHSASAYAVEFSLALYRNAVDQRRPVFAIRHPVRAEHTAKWLQLALPLRDDIGAVARLLAGTVAVGYDGRMIRA